MALYSGLEQNTDAQRQALLNAIAQQGRLGAQAHQAQSAQQGADFRSALASNAAITQGTGPGAPGGVLAKINADAAAQSATYTGDTGLANTAFQNFTSGVGQANDAYFRQASAAVPAMREQTQGIIAQIRAEQEAAALEREERRKQAEYDAMMRELDRQAAAEEQAFQREQWNFEREMMNRQLQEEATASSESDFEDRTAAYGDAVERRRADILSKVNSESGGDAPAVFEEIVSNTTNIEDAMVMARGILTDAAALAQQDGTEFDATVLPYMLQHIYAYFNPTEPIPDTGTLYNYMESAGLSDLTPAYGTMFDTRRQRNRRPYSRGRYAHGYSYGDRNRTPELRGRRPTGGN